MVFAKFRQNGSNRLTSTDRIIGWHRFGLENGTPKLFGDVVHFPFDPVGFSLGRIDDFLGR